MKVAAVSLAALALCSACSAAGKPRDPRAPRPAPTLLVASRGVVMPLAAAVRKIRFAPFVPSAQVAAVAVIPPLSDKRGRRADPGIAFEYESRGQAMVLSQWPRDGLTISVGMLAGTSRPCAPVAYQADGLLWTTRNGRVMTLQPDGTVSPSRIAREAARLLRAGACGGPRTLSRPLPARPSPFVSSPRRSAS